MRVVIYVNNKIYGVYNVQSSEELSSIIDRVLDEIGDNKDVRIVVIG